ncbi:hypothetical protein D3C86_2035510 [compost metagenome]
MVEVANVEALAVVKDVKVEVVTAVVVIAEAVAVKDVKVDTVVEIVEKEMVVVLETFLEKEKNLVTNTNRFIL